MGPADKTAGQGAIDVGAEECREMARTCAAFNLRRAARLVSQLFDEALRPTGLRITQFSLLVVALFQERQVMTNLARMMGLDRTTLSRNLKLLEKKGYVLLEPGEDRREVRVSITPAGLAKLEEGAPLWHLAQERILDGVGEAKWGEMLADLRALGKSLK